MTGLLERTRSGPSSGGRRSWVWRRAVPLAVVVALVAWVVGFTSVLGVHTVRVKGIHILNRAQVLSVAAVKQGQPLLRVDTTAIALRVEKLLPVASASVSVSYPSSVIITVVERTAVGVVSSVGTQALVDASNVVFLKVRTPPSGLPTLSMYGDERDAAITAVSGQLPTTLRARVGVVDAATPQAVTLHLRDGRTVVWGGSDRAGEKVQLMKVLLSQPGTYFDLSDPDTVISRGAPAPAPTN